MHDLIGQLLALTGEEQAIVCQLIVRLNEVRSVSERVPVTLHAQPARGRAIICVTLPKKQGNVGFELMSGLNC